jgi:hypothetical protein
VAYITGSQYHTLVTAVVVTLASSGACLAAVALPRPRRPGQLPYRRWHRLVPRRHAAVLAVLREYSRQHGDGTGLSIREIERRSGARCTQAVLRRLVETGWAERSCHPGITPYHMARSGYRLTQAGLTGTGRLTGAHLPGEAEELLAALAAYCARGRHRAPDLPPGHPSAPNPVIRTGLTEVRPRD